MVWLPIGGQAGWVSEGIIRPLEGSLEEAAMKYSSKFTVQSCQISPFLDYDDSSIRYLASEGI